MKKVSNGLKLIMAFVVIVVAAVYYYIKLPAINIHFTGILGIYYICYDNNYNCPVDNES